MVAPPRRDAVRRYGRRAACCIHSLRRSRVAAWAPVRLSRPPRSGPGARGARSSLVLPLSCPMFGCTAVRGWLIHPDEPAVRTEGQVRHRRTGRARIRTAVPMGAVVAYAKSVALKAWLGPRTHSIARIAEAHAQLGEVEGPGRPLELGRPLAHAYVIRVVAEFQAFTRDLYDLGAEHLVTVADPPEALVAVRSPRGSPAVGRWMPRTRRWARCAPTSGAWASATSRASWLPAIEPGTATRAEATLRGTTH